MRSLPEQSRRDGRESAWLAWAAGVLAVLVRLPYAAHRLWDHDSVQFALGVERYDLAAHQPHPPGYPLYVGLLKLLALGGLGPTAAMVAVTLVASALGAACVPLLVRALLGRDAPEAVARGPMLFAAALYVFDPLLWFYGELPLLYAVEGGLTVVLAWCVARMTDGGTWPLVRATLVLAVAGGLRPSSLALLAPLVAFGLWRAWRRGAVRLGSAAVAVAAGGAAVLAWALPLFALAGGYAAWKAINDAHFRTLLPATSVLYGAGFGALRHNGLLLAKWALQGVFPGALVLAAGVALEPRRLGEGLRALVRPALDRGGFLAAWALPAMAFFALFHVTKAGYTLVHLPALLVALALAAAPWLGTPRRGALAAAAAALVGAVLYLGGPDRVAGQAWWQVPWRHEFHGREVRAFERELDAVRAAIAGEDPAVTVLVAVELEGRGDGGAQGFLYSWHRHLQWYAPAFSVVALVPDVGMSLTTRGHAAFVAGGVRVRLPPGARRLVFVLAGETDARLPLPVGERLFDGERFHVRALALPPDGRIGPFTLLPGDGAETSPRPSS